MFIEIANYGLMCSSLIVGQLGEVHICGPDEWDQPDTHTYDSFWKSFEHARKIFEDKFNKDTPRSQGSHFDCYAFLLASTSQHQPETEKLLEKIGFWSSDRISKDKNPDSDVKVWVIPVRDFLKSYETWRGK